MLNFWDLNIKRHTSFKNRTITPSGISLPLESKSAPQLSKVCNTSIPSFTCNNFGENYNQSNNHSCGSSIYEENVLKERENIEETEISEGILKFTAEDYIQEIQKIEKQYFF
ncbi:hypothetical protein PNEG_00145 [Pneumocystis murina B123]|uniref:Uncharacterized protein n=1 Tax=Pneumocystis murina (strain B123) TaxID=1069680 RepID=M7NX24_PNEMU|nr:hypothetical protein PNEG_00145 [Pneumocystis murina B123]EMR11711.1 hypothetical protein PNEG_00145 [Pneumocystis murina B123]